MGLEEQGVPLRSRRAALVLLAALVAVLAVHLAVGLSDVLLYGLVGGLVGSLVVIGLDLLHAARRATERSLNADDRTNDEGEVR